MAQAMTHIQRLMLKIIFLLNPARRNSGEHGFGQAGQCPTRRRSDPNVEF
jgi:hypothetical protein